MGTTKRVARFIERARYEDIPQPALNMAKLCFLDVVGCALNASTAPATRIMLDFISEMGGNPSCHILGTSLRSNAIDAAMANALMSHLEDFDDMGTGHHATLLMPVSLALGEERHAAGKDVLTAYVVGFDITAYTTITLGSDHKGRGWHQTSTCGALGCAAVASRLQGLDEMQTRTALGIAASHAGGLRAAFGTMTKALHPANATRAGILAAKLAAKGFESNPNAIEDRFGFFAAFGEQQAQLVNLPRYLGNPWAMMARGRDKAEGIVLKRWPSCGFTHAIATILDRLLKTASFSSDAVERVDIVTTNDPDTMAANIRRPTTPRQGKFSPWYTAASHIIDRKLDMATFTDEAFNRPAVQDLLKRVNIVQDRDTAGRPQRALGGEEWWDLSITLKDGTTIVAERYEGHGDAYSWNERDAAFEKFRSLAGDVMKRSQIDSVINAVMELEKFSDVAKLIDVLAIKKN